MVYASPNDDWTWGRMSSAKISLQSRTRESGGHAGRRAEGGAVQGRTRRIPLPLPTREVRPRIGITPESLPRRSRSSGQACRAGAPAMPCSHRPRVQVREPSPPRAARACSIATYVRDIPPPPSSRSMVQALPSDNWTCSRMSSDKAGELRRGSSISLRSDPGAVDHKRLRAHLHPGELTLLAGRGYCSAASTRARTNSGAIACPLLRTT